MKCMQALLSIALSSLSLFGTTGAQEIQEARILESGKTIEREMSGGQTHSYQLMLSAGHYLHLVVEQRGIDVVVRVFAPDGKKLAEKDSPNGTLGPEPVSLVVEEAGAYRVEVRSLEKDAAGGRYEIGIREMRAATSKDKILMQGEQSFLAGELLRAQGRNEMWRRAIEKYEEAMTHWRAAEEISRQAQTLNKIGECYISLGEYQKAKTALDQALVFRRAANDRGGEADTLHQLGRAYYFSEDGVRALEYYNQALPIRRAVGDRSGEAAAINNIGLVYDNRGERRKALEYFEQALPIFRALKDSQNEGVALDNISRIYSYLGEKQKALEYYQQALALARAGGNRLREATTLHNLGNHYHSLGEMAKSLDFYGQSLAITRSLGDRRREALTLTSIGIVYDDMGEKQKALDLYMQALPVRRAFGDRRGEGITLHNLGSLYLDLGEYQKAFDYYNQALKISRDLGDRRGEAATLSRMGAVFDHLSEYQKALDHYGQALQIHRATEDRGGQAIALNNIGFVYNSLGEREKALDHYLQAAPLLQASGARFQQGALYDNIGKVYLSKGEKEKAMEYFNQALSLHQAVGNRDGQGISLNNLGLLHNSLGDRRKAIDYYNQSLALYQATSNRMESAHTLHNLGRAYAGLGERQKALDYLNQALTINRTLGDREGEAITRYGIALVERESGNLKEAQSQAAAALDLIESLRTGIATQELRASFFATVQEHYALTVELLMQMHRLHPTESYAAQALEVSERARARSLLDTLAEARADIRQGVDPALIDRERGLQQQLNAREQARAQLLSRKHTPEQAEAVEKEIRELATQYENLQAQIRTGSPRYAALTQPRPLKLEGIQREVLDADTLLLQYALGSERSYLWAVSRESISAYELPKRDVVEAAARKFYDSLIAYNQPSKAAAADNSKTREAAAALSKILLSPVAAQLGVKRLLIVADGALRYVPFAALPDPSSSAPPSTSNSPPLIVGHEVISLPSASSLAVLRRELAGRKPAPKALAIFADPVFAADDLRLQRARSSTVTPPGSPGETTEAVQSLTRSARESGLSDDGLRIPRLPGTRREAAAIAALIPEAERRQSLDFDANRAAATSPELGHYRIIHFATHGLLNSSHPGLSGIVLSLVDQDGNPLDGFLRLHEIYNLKLPAELVVLSACQTGLGKEIRGEGLVGLTRGFMYAGAGRVVASLWKVDDRATAELMKNFYRGMTKEGLPPSAALRAAQIQMWKQKRWQEPYFWAAFTLQGEWK